MRDEFKITSTLEWDALHAFDAENNVEPVRTIAERIALAHGLSLWHSLVDDISHALEDAMDIGRRRVPLETTAINSTPSLTLDNPSQITPHKAGS